MTNLRVAVLIGGAGLLAAWLSSAAGTVPAPVTDSQIGGGTTRAQAAVPAAARLDIDREVGRLASRLDNAPRPRRPARNPFTLTSLNRATSPPSQAATLRSAPAGADRAPAVSLAGIGVERTSYGFLRTAILAADGRVILASIGDEVMGRFQVRAVTNDSVELFDLRDGTVLRLTLP